MSEDTTLSGSAEPLAQPDSKATTEEVKTEAAEKTVETPVEEAPKEPEQQAAEDAKPKRSRYQDRIDQLTHGRREAERTAQSAQAEAERLRERLSQYEAAPPRESEFDSIDAYQAALTAYHVKQSMKGEREAEAQDAENRAKSAQETAQQTAVTAYNARLAEAAETIPDIYQVINDPTTPISETMAGQIMDAEQGPQIAYYLAKNPGDAARIASITDPYAVAREIGRIEGRLRAPEPKRVSSAPEPVKAVATGSGSQGSFDPSKASPKEFGEHFKKRGIIS